jgi:hypothetical protein
LTLGLLLLGFTISSSLGGAVSENLWWMLAVGVLCSLVLPSLLASWMRSLRRGKGGTAEAGEGSRRIRQPSTLVAIAVANLLLVAGSGLLAPDTVGERLTQHGSWWVERIVHVAGGTPKNPMVQGAQRTAEWLAGVIPGRTSAGKATGAPATSTGDGAGLAPTDGAVAVVAPPLGDSAAMAPDGAAAVVPAGEVRLAFERQGSSIVVPVVLHGPVSPLEAKMLFDTGATLSTLDGATLRRLNVSVPPDSPTVEVQTANGKVRRHITVIDGVTLGGSRVADGVTVSLCEPCAQGDVVGLLGLNVQRQFKVTIDHEASQIVLHPKASSRDGRLLDIRPFLKLDDAKGRWRGPMLTVQVTLRNQSPRAVRYLKLAAEIRQGDKEGRIWGEQRDIPAGARVPMTIEGLPSVKGGRFQLRAVSADW